MNNYTPYMAESIYNKDLLDDALFYRSIGIDIDNNPELISNYFSNKALLRLMQNSYLSNLEKVKQFEVLSYGDPGITLAAPGPMLAGVFIDECADVDQKAVFYNKVSNKSSRTFFAVTEPGVGSNIGHLCTKLNKQVNGKYLLSGKKYFIGSGVAADIGVVLVRTGDRITEIKAVLLDTEFCDTSRLLREIIPVNSLKVLGLAKLEFLDIPIEKDYILQKNSKYGAMLSLIKVFTQMRSGVGALAIGVAQGVIDYVIQNVKTLSKNQHDLIRYMLHKISMSRDLLHHAAQMVEQDILLNIGLVSAAKVEATKAAEFVVKKSLEFFDGLVFVEHPFIEKSFRDVFAFEYMEGTSNIHHANVLNSYLQNRLIY